MNTSLIIAYIIVFVLSAIPLFEAFVVVPVGILGGMNFTMTLIIGILGNLVTLLLIIVLMDRHQKMVSRTTGTERQHQGP